MYSIIRNTCIGKATQLEAAVISLSRTFRCEFHVSVALNKQIKRSPENKHRLQHPIRTSWGKMVSRGMRVKEPVTKYTVKPQPVQKTGGRGVTGRREIGYIGGGLPVVWHMTDCVRITKNEQDPKVEVVKEIIPEQTRSSHIALVIGGERKRWIMATESMKVGDMIKSTRDIPHIPVMPQAGDCHPVGALPIGTQVCQVERYPFDGSKVGNAAGVSMTLLRKSGDKVTLRMPSKREMTVSEQCLCVVGRNSDVERNKRQLGKAGAKRQLGYRPSSGLRMKKTGLHGRKIKSIKKSREYTEPETQETEVLKFTLPLHFTQGRHRGVTLWY